MSWFLTRRSHVPGAPDWCPCFDKGGPSSVPTPDPAATAAAQGAANKEAVRESAKVNQFNQVTPYGSRTYTGEIGSPERLETTALSPEGQAQFNAKNRLAGTLLGSAENLSQFLPANALSFEGIPQDRYGSTDRQAVEDAYFQSGRRLLDPIYEQQERRLENRLTNQGLPQTGEAYRTATEDFGRGRDDAYSELARQAFLQGGSEQSRLAGLNLAGRQQDISELLTERQQPFNELSAFIQGSPALQSPSFSPAAAFGVAPADYLGARQLAQNAELTNYQGQAQTYFNNQQGLGQAGGLAAGALAAAFLF